MPAGRCDASGGSARTPSKPAAAMPELPEVETVRRGIDAALTGQRIARVDQRRPDLRWPMPPDLPERLTGRRIEAARRRGKYILLTLDDGQVVLLHLGMSGRVVIAPHNAHRALLPHDHVILDTVEGQRLTFHDPRRFGAILMAASMAEMNRHPLLAGMGPEPLEPAFTAEVLSAALTGRRTPIKAALLDQKVVAGLGNIYVCEALFLSGISPKRLAASVPGKRAERLVPAIRKVLQDAIASGGSSLRDYVQASGELGYFQYCFSVYDRVGEACPGCTCDVTATGGIQRIVQSNRSTYFCPRKQR